MSFFSLMINRFGIQTLYSSGGWIVCVRMVYAFQLLWYRGKITKQTPWEYRSFGQGNSTELTATLLLLSSYKQDMKR